MDFAKITAEEAKTVLSHKPVALLPIGAVEAHGAHLPLGTDNFLAEGVARKVADRLEQAVILPTLSYGQVWSLRDFPGTLSISNEVLIGLIADIGRSLFRQGVRILALINGHMGNLVAMREAARLLYDECPEMKVLFFTYPGVAEITKQVCESERPHASYFHACEIETSYMLYVAPEHVRMDKAVRDMPEFPPEFEVMNVPWHEITTTGVLGDATLATYDKGKAIIDTAIHNIVALIKKVEADLDRGQVKELS